MTFQMKFLLIKPDGGGHDNPDFPWIDTGVDLQAGQRVTIQAVGRIHLYAPVNEALMDWTDPDGCSDNGDCNLNPEDLLIPDRPGAKLIARYGSSGTPVEIGKSYDSTASQSGHLYLTINDYIDFSGQPEPWVLYDNEYYTDNRGFFQVILLVDYDAPGIPDCSSLFCEFSRYLQKSSVNPIRLHTGEKVLTSTDLALASPAAPLAFTRYYQQAQQNNSDFQFMGLGWSHNHHFKLTVSGTAPTRTAAVVLPEGGTLQFSEVSSNLFSALPESGATLEHDTGAGLYSLVGQDQSRFSFEASSLRLLERRWPQSESWFYSYYTSGDGSDLDGKLKRVSDGDGRYLEFSYIRDSDPNAFQRRKLRRVTDHSGRYVELSYTESKQESGGMVINGGNSLLSSIRDVRDESWTFSYETSDLDTLNYLLQRQSPAVDTHGDPNTTEVLTLEALTYEKTGATLDAIEQSRGNGLLQTRYEFQPGAQNMTTEAIAGQLQRHYFLNGVYLGPSIVPPDEAQGHPETFQQVQVVGGQYRALAQADANGHQTSLIWSTDGRTLEGVEDALAQRVRFDYDLAERLQVSSDAAGQQTFYSYLDSQRQPTLVVVGQDAGLLPLDGDLESIDGWLEVGTPTTGVSSEVVDSGVYALHVETTQADDGIESPTFDLQAYRSYQIEARVHLISGQVKMQVSGTSGFEAISSDETAIWQTLRAVHTVSSGEAGSRRLQFLAEGGAAEFYVDSLRARVLPVIDLNGAMEASGGWTAISGAAPAENEWLQPQVEVDAYARRVLADAANEGIETAAPTLQSSTSYTLTARVFPVSGQVKMQVSGTSGFDVTSSGTGSWQNLTVMHTPSGTLTSEMFQLIAAGAAAEFYIGEVHLSANSAAVFDDDMSQKANWTAISGAQPVLNWRTPRADSGLQVRRVRATADGQGIESGVWDLQAERCYLLLARVYPFSGQVKLQASGTSGLDVLSSTETAAMQSWQTLRAVYRPTSGSSGVKLQAVAEGGAAEFYLDSVQLLDLAQIHSWQDFRYDHRGRTLEEQIVDPASGALQRQTQRVYVNSGNGAGLLESLTQRDLLDADDQTTVYTYDSLGRVIKTQQVSLLGSCQFTYTVYDAAGNVEATVCGRHSHTIPTTVAEAQALYDANDAQKKHNRVTIHVYDAIGRRVATTTNYGMSTEQTNRTFYDALDRVVRTIANYVPQGSSAPGDWVWDVTDGRWEDGSDNPISLSAEDVRNQINDTVYNERGQVRLQRDAQGHVTLFGYDAYGRLVKTVRNAAVAGHNNTYLVSDPGDDPTLDDDPANTPDPALASYPWQQPGVLDPRPDYDLVSQQVYDAAGNRVKAVDVSGQATFYVYDALNRGVKTLRAASLANYDILADPTLANYGLSSAGDQDIVEETLYDVRGRVLEQISPMGQITRYVYDALGRQVRVVRNYVPQGSSNPADWTLEEDDGILKWFWREDPESEANKVNHGAGQFEDEWLNFDRNIVTETVYNAQGQVAKTITFAGDETHHEYDGLGRQIQTIVNYADGMYDTGQTDEDVITTTEYNTDGQVFKTIDSRGNETRYSYDDLGRRIQTTVNYLNGVYDSANPDEDLISTVHYDDEGRVYKTVDSAGIETRTVFDARGRAFRTIRNYVVQGASDPADWLWDAAQSRWEDGAGTPIDHGTNHDQNLIGESLYDVYGRVMATRDVFGTQTAFGYDAAGRRVLLTQAAGSPQAVATYTCYDKAGRVLRSIQNYLPLTDPAGQPIAPDARDGQTWLFDPELHGVYNDQNLITTYTYDNAGRQQLVADPLGQVTETNYHKDGQVEWLLDAQGYTMSYGYDGLRRRITVVQNRVFYAGVAEPGLWRWSLSEQEWDDGSAESNQHFSVQDNITVQVEHDRGGQVARLRNPAGYPTYYEYDRLGRRTKLTNPADTEWLTAYTDVSGGKARTTLTYPGLSDATPYTVQRDTDRLGRLASIDYGAPGTTPSVKFAYDAVGSRIKMSEYSGSGFTNRIRETLYGYDDLQRLISVGFDDDGDGDVDQTVSYAYDLAGRRTHLTMPGGLMIAYTYNRRGQLIAMTDWDDQQTHFVYDNLGRHIATERHNGLRSRYAYDAAGRLRTLRHDAGQKTLAHFAYEVNALGNRTQALEVLRKPGTGTTTVAHDNKGIFTVGTWSSVSGFRETTLGDAALRLMFLGEQNVQLTMGQGPNHSLYDVYLGGTLWQSFDGYAASAGQRVIDIALTGEGPHLLELRNRAEHSLSAQADGGYTPGSYTLRFKQLAVDGLYDLQTIGYTYDPLSRLTNARYFAGVNTALADGQLPRRYAYNYSRTGNRLGEAEYINGAQTHNHLYSYSFANQLVRDRDTLVSGWDYEYLYDANGNMYRKKEFGGAVLETYDWDRANRMLSFGSSSYKYAGDGSRIQQTVSSVVTDYLLDIQPGLVKVIAQTTGSDTERFIHSLRGIHAMEDAAGVWTYPMQDGLGSVRMEASDALAVGGSQNFAPYGTPFDTNGSFDTSFGFTGEQTDANGLLYLRTRYYNSAVGVFTALDPFEGIMRRPMSRNGYSWVEGNVVNLIDPMGLCGGDFCNPSTLSQDQVGCWQNTFGVFREYGIVIDPIWTGIAWTIDQVNLLWRAMYDIAFAWGFGDISLGKSDFRREVGGLHPVFEIGYLSLPNEIAGSAAQYNPMNKRITLHPQHAMSAPVDFIKSAMVHELAHFMADNQCMEFSNYHFMEFVGASCGGLGFIDRAGHCRSIYDPGNEGAVSSYAARNNAEDLAVSFEWFIYRPDELARMYPLRYSYFLNRLSTSRVGAGFTAEFSFDEWLNHYHLNQCLIPNCGTEGCTPYFRRDKESVRQEWSLLLLQGGVSPSPETVLRSVTSLVLPCFS